MEEPTLFGVVEKWLERTPFLKTKTWNFWDCYKEGVEAMIQKDRLVAVVVYGGDEWVVGQSWVFTIFFLGLILRMNGK